MNQYQTSHPLSEYAQDERELNTAQEPKDVQLWLDHLRRAISENREIIAQLGEELLPILNTQDSPTREHEQDRGASTPLGQNIKDEAQNLEIGNDVLKEILRKIEV